MSKKEIKKMKKNSSSKAIKKASKFSNGQPDSDDMDTDEVNGSTLSEKP